VLIALEVFAAPRTQVQLILDKQRARPGETVWAGLRFQMASNWHTYWQNSGDSGAPTTVHWSLPRGITAGSIQWPVPEKHVTADLTTYVYYGEVILLVPLALSQDLAPGPYDMHADVTWLECETLCVPGEASMQAALIVAQESNPSPQAALIESWRGRLPKTRDDLPLKVRWDSPSAGNTRVLNIEWPTHALPPAVDFFPLTGEGYEVVAGVERHAGADGTLQWRIKVRKSGPQWPSKIPGLLLIKEAGQTASTGYQVKLIPQAGGMAPGLGVSGHFLKMLLYAFLGGLILNVMPCVLPVIALKILGFVNQSRETRQRIRIFGLLYAGGILVSFLLLAGIVIGVQAAGRRASWGMQFGNPQFLVVVCALVTLVALNLFGVFEVVLGGRVMGAAGELAAREGKAGAFFNGVLATLLATPCTAPFLGSALGFAFFQPPAFIALFFLTVGAGLAAPYVILSWQPGWLKFLPKPGAWMVRLKVAMGFPMLATAVWLFFMVVRHYDKRSLWLGLFLVLMAMAAWIYGEFVQRGRSHKGLALMITLALLVGGYVYALEHQLRWRSPVSVRNDAESLQETPDGIPWRKWSPQAVDRARAEGKVVLVDFTADWCLICYANQKLSLEIRSVRAQLEKINAATLLADYTKPAAAPEITDELNRFGRAGVPLVLVYPRQTNRPPIVLPEWLTPQIVLHALEEAAR
jgi:thiol:disulfide interchange protein DsbD